MKHRPLLVSLASLALAGCATTDAPTSAKAPNEVPTLARQDAPWPYEPPEWAAATESACDEEVRAQQPTVAFECHLIQGPFQETALVDITDRTGLQQHGQATLSDAQANTLLSLTEVAAACRRITSPRVVVWPDQPASIKVGQQPAAGAPVGLRVYLRAFWVEDDYVRFRCALQHITGYDDEGQPRAACADAQLKQEYDTWAAMLVEHEDDQHIRVLLIRPRLHSWEGLDAQR